MEGDEEEGGGIDDGDGNEDLERDSASDVNGDDNGCDLILDGLAVTDAGDSEGDDLTTGTATFSEKRKGKQEVGLGVN